VIASIRVVEMVMKPTALLNTTFVFLVNRILAGKPEGKRPLGRPRRRLVDNIKTDLREIRWDGVD
jgi:hypothetical protein